TILSPRLGRGRPFNFTSQSASPAVSMHYAKHGWEGTWISALYYMCRAFRAPSQQANGQTPEHRALPPMKGRPFRREEPHRFSKLPSQKNSNASLRVTSGLWGSLDEASSPCKRRPSSKLCLVSPALVAGCAAHITELPSPLIKKTS